jgi:hypothetical protein
MTQRKLAVFVEGQTEQVLLRSLVAAIAGENNIHFDQKLLVSDKLITLQQVQPIPARQPADVRYFVLLVNCQNDERVKSVILDQRESLARANYSLILGLRDLNPNKLHDLSAIKAKLAYRVPTAGIPTHILLAVSEVEAWFLQEHSHFARIDNRLDVSTFKANFGFDPVNESAETIQEAAALLHRIYSTVGKAYHKDRKRVQRTVDALDYSELYVSLPEKLPHLKEFILHIDTFLTEPAAVGGPAI